MKKIQSHIQLPAKWILILIVLGLLGVIAVHFDNPVYQQTIVRITHVTNSKAKSTTDEFNNEDSTVTQKLTGIITNGRRKGQTVHLKNTYTGSHATDQRYYSGNQVFISHNNLITDYKRDTSVALLFWIAFSLLLLIMQWTGMRALLSVLLNAVLFFIAIEIDLAVHGSNILLIFGGLSIVFTSVTLWIVLGFNRQMAITLGATLSGTAIAMALSWLVITLTGSNGVYYEAMQYVTQTPKPLFLAETLLGSLGAVMDESTDIISSLFQLKKEQPDISAHQIFNSGREIGREIMGPLINVLFLIFVADTFPMAVLFLRNGNSWGYTFNMNMSLGITQSLVSGIGIVLAIPAAAFLAGHFSGGERK
ncbi:YibE/F family protein [Lactobacillus selangorensis]|nr:YibE/F family protein [Lactobacillus selangorensis]